MDTKLKWCAHVIKLIILTTLSALFIYPIGLAIFIPISLYKKVINCLIKKWDSKICQMISGLSAIMVGGNPYSKPDFVLMSAYPVKSTVDRKQVIDVLNKQIFATNQFPELSQRIVRKFGYNFWYKTDKIMTAADHVHYLNPKYPDEPITRSQILGIQAPSIAQKPFAADRSPWEIILVPNFYDEDNPSNKSLVILRTHHCLMDGYTVINFMKAAAVKPWKENKHSQTTSNQKSSNWLSLQQLIILFITGPYHVIRQALFSNDNSDFMKMVFTNQQNKGDQQILISKEPRPRIPMNRLKNIQKLHNANISSILITLVMGCTVQFIKKRWGTVEKNMYLQMTYPIPGHPGKPTNHWTTVRLPIYFQESDPVGSLKRNMEEYDNIRNSVIPTLNFYVTKLLGMLPVFLIPNSEDISKQVIVFSNVPGAVGNEDIFGYLYDDMTVRTVIRKGTAFVFGCISTGGKIGINFGANLELLKTDEDIANIQESLENILANLETSNDY